MKYTNKEIVNALRDAMAEGFKIGVSCVARYIYDEDDLKRANKFANKELRRLYSIDMEEAVDAFNAFEKEAKEKLKRSKATESKL